MAVKMKRSAVAGKVPTTTQLELGELAVNTYDGRLFFKKDDGSETIIALPGPGLPPGSIVHVAQSSAPDGFLKANGAAISRITYADLFSAIGTTFGVGNGSTTFNLPDLRGEFMRGWDDARGVDSGRTFGSSQTDDLGSHNHFLAANVITSAVYPTPTVSSSNQISYGNGTGGGYERYNLSGTSSAADVGRSSSTGGSETRPRNIALLACIKY